MFDDFDNDSELFGGRNPAQEVPHSRTNVREILELMQELQTSDVELLVQVLQGLLPTTELKKLDMEEELALQYRDAKALQARLLVDPYAANNHKAQVLGQVTNALQKIAALQTKVHDSEQVKLIEQALVLTLQEQPNAETLLNSYQGHLERLTRSKKK